MNLGFEVKISYRVVFFFPLPLYVTEANINPQLKGTVWIKGYCGALVEVCTLLFSQEVWKTEVCKKKSFFSTLPVHQSIYKMLNTLCLRFKDACETHYEDTLGGWKINLSDFYIISAKECMRLDSNFLSRSMHSRSLCARVTVFLFDHLLFSLYCISICSSLLVLIYFLRTKSPRPNFLPKLISYCGVGFLQR